MITADFARMMARYNRWQNRSIYEVAGTLDDAARQVDRGAFFGSIEGTLRHLFWGDTIWMSRFSDWDRPDVGIPESASYGPKGFEALREERAAADERIVHDFGTLTDAGVEGDLRWYSGALARDVEKPISLCLTHFFNHQTHHRGQVHAMLTAAGARPGDTDLFIMPEEG